MKKFETQYVDIPEISETFADSLGKISMDGETMRMELCVTRLDELKSPAPTGKKYPVCRIVLTPSAAADLYNQLHMLIAALEKSGAVTRQKPSSASPKH